MKNRNQVKIRHLAQKSAIAVTLLLICLIFEPCFKQSFSFAVTLFDNSKAASESNTVLGPTLENTGDTSEPVSQKSRAPEPSTLFLLLSGLSGMIVRFARRSFDKFKRFSDIVLALAGLTVASPLLIFAAILIKFNSRGPVVYRQKRVGLNGEIFLIHKLRTMRMNAEKFCGAVWAKENDPRVTNVGKVLRKAHIDEIPQLFNVLKGEMSIIGPRPERPEIVNDLKTIIHDYEKRLQVKPGITGLAQVWHKYDETIADVKKKIKFDLLYIRKMCLLADLKILASTVVVVLTGRGAR
jgi:lipopolysaccharide/colanic/teichoic acid biosynthesis glycosyltransferase